jgi:hypothetical protein
LQICLWGGVPIGADWDPTHQQFLQGLSIG